jgi:hypothetical protein
MEVLPHAEITLRGHDGGVPERELDLLGAALPLWVTGTRREPAF